MHRSGICSLMSSLLINIKAIRMHEKSLWSSEPEWLQYTASPITDFPFVVTVSSVIPFNVI